MSIKNTIYTIVAFIFLLFSITILIPIAITMKLVEF